MHRRGNQFLIQRKEKINLLQKPSKSKSKYQSIYERKRKNMIDISAQLIAHEPIDSQLFTFPFSTDGNRTSRRIPKIMISPSKKSKHKNKGEDLKQKSKSIHSKSKKSKSKDIDSRKKKEGVASKIKQKPSKKLSPQTKKRSRKPSNPLPNFNYSKLLSPQSFSKAFKITRANSKQTKNQQGGQNYEQILQQYGQFLTIAEIGEIKQYKTIYFLGKIKQRKNRKLFNSAKKTPLSARQKQNRSLQRQQGIQISNLMTERKVNKNDDDEVLQTDEQFLTKAYQFYVYELGDHIAYRYEILQTISRGAFGEVIKVFDHKYKELEALKIIKKNQQLVQQTLVQITILTHIREKDKQNLSGIVKIKDFTIFRRHICIAFELLDGNLYQFVAANNHCGLTENAIRIFAVQLLNSLSFLKKQKIIHCDLKPENIVMKKWGKSGIKLVDFGTSCFDGKQIYEYLQSRYYRSPQIILRKQYNYSIDMWSLGCILVELKLGEPLYPANSDKEHLMYFSKSIGLPSSKESQYSNQLRQNKQINEIIQEHLLQQYQLIKDDGQKLKNHSFFSTCKYLLKGMKKLKERLKQGQIQCSPLFIQFLSKILVWDPSKRYSPEEALQDPWISEGIPRQVKEIYTYFTSRDKSKDSKHKKSREKSTSLPKKEKKKNRQSKILSKPKKQQFEPKIRQRSMQFSAGKSVILKKQKKHMF